MKTKTLCVPCAVRLAEHYDVRQTGRKSEKITCEECRKRRYGYAYTVAKKMKEE